MSPKNLTGNTDFLLNFKCSQLVMVAFTHRHINMLDKTVHNPDIYFYIHDVCFFYHSLSEFTVPLHYVRLNLKFFVGRTVSTSGGTYIKFYYLIPESSLIATNCEYPLTSTKLRICNGKNTLQQQEHFLCRRIQTNLLCEKVCRVSRIGWCKSEI